MENEPKIYHEADVIKNAPSLFEQLLNSVDWDTRMQRRQTASFGRAYNYSGMVYPSTPMPESLLPICDAIRQRVALAPNNCLLNRYSDGESTMGYHSDSVSELAPGTGVAIVSLGSTREIVFRLIADKEVKRRYALAPGSLLYMDSAVQHLWRHGVPRQSGAGPRISLTFRQIADNYSADNARDSS